MQYITYRYCLVHEHPVPNNVLITEGLWEMGNHPVLSTEQYITDKYCIVHEHPVTNNEEVQAL